MLKKIAIGLLSIFVLAGCGSDKSLKNNLIETTALGRSSIDIIFKSMSTFPKNVQISMAKIKDGEVHYYGALRSGDSVDTVVNHKKAFMIASISKVFTSTLLAQMVLDGKIALDDNIQDKLPFALHNNVAISYKQLSNHTSGLIRHLDATEEKQNALNMTDIENYLKHDLKLEYAQGTHHYSNLGAGVLGYMMTHIENKPYETLLQERIFDKLGMKHSTTLRENVQSILVPALMPNDDTVPLAYTSAGGILSTVSDLTKFAFASLGDEPEYVLTQKVTLEIDDTTSLGLGWVIKKGVDSGRIFYFHNGSTQGYKSVIILDRENQNGIIILANLPVGDVTGLGAELMEEMYK